MNALAYGVPLTTFAQCLTASFTLTAALIPSIVSIHTCSTNTSDNPQKFTNTFWNRCLPVSTQFQTHALVKRDRFQAPVTIGIKAYGVDNHPGVVKVENVETLYWDGCV